MLRSPRFFLPTLLISTVVIPIVSTVGLTSYLSYRASYNAVKTLATQVIDQASKQIEQRLREYFASPYAINRINAVAIQQGHMTPKSQSSLLQHFWQQRFLFDQVCGAAIYVGSPDGEFVGLGWQRTDGTWRIGRAGESTGGKFHSYTTDKSGNPLKLILVGSQPFVVQQRPWYRAATQAKAATWSPVYPDFSQGDLKIALSEPVYDAKGNLLAVVGVDCLFSSITDFLEQLEVGRSGNVFIMERSGNLIASSSIKLPFNQNAQRFNALTIEHDPIRQATIQLQQQHGAISTIDQPQQFAFTLAGEPHFAQVIPFVAVAGIDWLIVVTVAKSEFMAEVDAQAFRTLWICLGVFGLMLVVSVSVAQRITQPISYLSNASQQLSQGKLDQPVPISRIHEIAQLATSFNQMSQQIQQSRTQLETYAQALEHKVQERTRALELSQERLQLAMQGANDGLWDWNLVTNEVYFSPRYKEMLGYADHELPNQLSVWLDRLHPDDRQAALAETQRCVQRSPHRYEHTFRLKHRDGHYRWILSRGYGIWNDTGNLVRLVGVHIDITDRKQAERAIQMGQQRLLLQNTVLVSLARSEAITQGNWRTAVQEVTQTVAQQLGIERVSVWLFGNGKTKLRCADLYDLHQGSHLQGMELASTQCPSYFRALAIDDIITAQDAQTDPRTHELAADYLQPLGISAMLDAPIRLRGKIIGVLCLERVGIPLSWTLEDRGFARSLAGLVALAMETHQRDIVETALWDSEAKFRTLVANIPGIVYRCLYDEHWTMTFLSNEIFSITGYPDSDFIYNQTRTFTSIIHPDDRAFVAEVVRAAVASHQTYILDYRLCCADGGERWVSEKGQCVFDEAGNPLWLDGVIFDISDRKQVEHELEQAKAAADAANQAKSEFLANMSHELRSPLNAILGFAQLMSHSPDLSPNHRETTNIILRSGEHLLMLINNILDLSKIEAGQITLNESDCDLASLLQDLENMFRLRAREKSLTLTIDRHPSLPRYIITDQVKLRQVLINLLSNSVKFTQKGYVILRASTAPFHSRDAHPTTDTDQTTIYFAVEDTGPGIAPEDIEHLFQSFSQTDSGKSAQEGTGLGLAISQRFVRLMGGDLAVSSNLGQGTTFQFAIPVRVTSGTSPCEFPNCHAIALAPGQPTYRILVVDDKPTNRQLLVKLLVPLGFEVREAGNGEEAIACWDAWEPHLIWMDMRMPVMDGYTATRIIKETTKGQATAIIALTASALEDQKVLILSTGCDGFVRKPFREEDIITAMEKHIGAQFIYANPLTNLHPSNPTTSESYALSAELLSSLPQDWLANFQQAVQTIDLEHVRLLLASIQPSHPALETALQHHIDNFQYEQVLTAIQHAQHRLS
jgi:PAS domain S-box-containing protein